MASGILRIDANEPGNDTRIGRRAIVEHVIAAAESLHLVHERLCDDWVIRLSSPRAVRHVVGYKFDINPAASSLAVRDKVAAHLLLAESGLASVRHVLLRYRPHMADSYKGVGMTSAKRIAHEVGYPLIAKPVRGTSGNGLYKLDSEVEFEKLLGERSRTWALSPFTALVAEYRVVMLDGQALLVYEKEVDNQAPAEIGFLMHNLSHGARPVELFEGNALYRKLSSMAQKSLRSLNLRMASVDIVDAGKAGMMVMEVNDGLMLEHFGRSSDHNYGTARAIYKRVVQAMFA